MNSSLSFRSGLRALLVAAVLVLLAEPSALAQRPAGPRPGGGGHGSGYHGPSMHGPAPGGGYHGGAVHPNHGYYGGGHGYYGRGRGYYRPVGWGWGGWGWGWGWGLGWGGWGWGYPGWGYGYPGWGAYYGAGGYATLAPGDWAIIATDVSPETTRVFLDGRFIGMVEDFNGPEFLYLKKGDYQLEFRLDGFETKTINLSAQKGAQMKISEKLKKIPGAAQFGSYENPEPEGGVQRYWTKEKSASSNPVNVQAGPNQAQPWRGNDESTEGSQADAGQEPTAAESGSQAAMDPAPQSPTTGSSEAKSRARLIFRIMPGDAAVYLNDHFIGTGEELSTLTRGFQVPPGQHSITVSRPGLETREETVVVGPGKSETVEIALQRNER